MKAIRTFLMIGVFSLSLLGCGKGNKGGRPASGPVDLEQVDPSGQKITFWHQHTRQREDELNALIADFNKSNKFGIEVAGEYAGNYGDIYNKMLAGIRSGELPNLVVAYQNQAAGYALGEALVDLNDYVDSKKWGLTEADKADFFPAFWKQDVFPALGNRRLGFPPNRSMEVLYYNEDWLRELGREEPPATWAEFEAVCLKARQQPFSKAAAPNPVGYVLSVDASRFAAMVFSRGGEVANADCTAYTLNTPAARAVLAMVQRLSAAKALEPEVQPDADQTEFASGRALFNIGSTSGLLFYESAVEAGAKFNWSIAPLPHSTPEPVLDVYGASVSIPVTTPEAQLAAWLFVKWLTEPAQQARWVKASNYFPTRQSTADSLADYFEQNPRYAKAFKLLPYGKSEPAFAGYDEVRTEIERAMADAMDGADLDKTLTTLQEKADELLKEAQE